MLLGSPQNRRCQPNTCQAPQQQFLGTKSIGSKAFCQQIAMQVSATEVCTIFATNIMMDPFGMNFAWRLAYLVSWLFLFMTWHERRIRKISNDKIFSKIIYRASRRKQGVFYIWKN